MSKIKHKGIKGITVKNLSQDCRDWLEKSKKTFNVSNNREFFEKLAVNSHCYDDEFISRLDDFCLKMKIDDKKDDLMKKIIDKYMIKTLKSHGLHKEKHKKSAKAEQELIDNLHAIIAYYETLPQEEKKYLSVSMIHKFLIKNEDKYKQKNLNVIRRVLNSPEADFVKEYHEQNNLTVKSNTRITK
jgi:hypothetical protein